MRKIKKNKLICQLCSRDFIAINNYGVNQQPIYCSSYCRTSGKRKSMIGKNTGPRLDMLGPGNPNWMGKSKHVIRTRKEINCEYCNLLFNYTPEPNRVRRFCSVDCRLRGDKGDKHKNWRGGVASERTLAMTKPAYKNWRKSVFERDNYTCQKCFKRGIPLNADHIKAWSKYKDLRYEVSNGRTLCVECHRKTETYGGRVRWQD